MRSALPRANARLQRWRAQAEKTKHGAARALIRQSLAAHNIPYQTGIEKKDLLEHPASQATESRAALRNLDRSHHIAPSFCRTPSPPQPQSCTNATTAPAAPAATHTGIGASGAANAVVQWSSWAVAGQGARRRQTANRGKKSPSSPEF